METKVEIIPSDLSAEEIAQIKEYFYENRKYESENEYGRPGWSYESLFYIGLYKQGEDAYDRIDDRAKLLLKVLDKCEEYFLENYEMNWTFAYKRGFLNCMEKGAFLPSHSDDEDIYDGKRKEEIHYSALLFLTGPDEYEGGDVFFWERHPEGDIEHGKYKPNVGDLVMFKGSTMHGVEEIVSGERINFVIFYRDYNEDSDMTIDGKEEYKARIKAVNERPQYPDKRD